MTTNHFLRLLPVSTSGLAAVAASLLIAGALPLAAQDPDTAQDAAPSDFEAPGTPADPGLPPGSVNVIDMSAGAPPPPNLDQAEIARSRECVPVLSRVQALSADLEPLRQRTQRIRALHSAVTVEDSTRAGPLNGDDPLESRVGEWFREDQALAERIVEMEDESAREPVQEERQAGRTEMLAALEDAFAQVNQEIETTLDGAGDVGALLPQCEGRILVRSAVVEACDADPSADQSSVCQAARADEATGRLQFVESPADLWDIEQLRPWTQPARIQPAPDGGLTGARTTSITRRGNAYLSVSLEPLIQPRSAVAAEQAERFDANLDSLGVAFDHPDFVMSPALAFELDLPSTLGGETDYLLHFGDLSNPATDVIRTMSVPERWPAGGAFSPTEATLVRIAQGEPLSMTAVRMTEDEDEADIVFSLGLTQVLQAEMVTALLQYLADGSLSADLEALIPPGSMEEAAGGGDAPDGNDGNGGPGTAPQP